MKAVAKTVEPGRLRIGGGFGFNRGKASACLNRAAEFDRHDFLRALFYPIPRADSQKKDFAIVWPMAVCHETTIG